MLYQSVISPRLLRYKAALLLVLALGFATQALANHQSPPILDFFPNCDHQVIDVIKVHVIVPASPGQAQHDKLTKAIPKLLHKLRNKASERGADAIILMKRQLKQIGTEVEAARLVTRLRYTARLIKNCDAKSLENATSENLPAPYNHKGQQIIGYTPMVVSTISVAIELPEKARLNHPKLSNHEVSIKNGVYGVKLGMSYQQVIAIWGTPSVELAVLEKELVIGFGRRHWLHFQGNKLVRISDTSLLSIEVVNEVPMRGFFDNKGWKVNNKVGLRATLAQVLAALKDVRSVSGPATLTKDNRLLVEQNGQVLALQFAYRQSITGVESYDLTGFTLQTKAYQPQTNYRLPDAAQQATLYSAINQTYQQLKLGQDTDLASLRAKLGEPIGRITLSVSNEIEIYDSHILLRSAADELAGIQLLEQTLVIKQTSKPWPWRLGMLKQGQSFVQAKAVLTTDAVGTEEQLEFDGDTYGVTLFFAPDDNDMELSYMAELKVY
ncbi:MAG: hypothetical protein ACI8WB_005716 [Phenylobacterium sp.]|jgi:hypothetical protein